MEIIFLITLLIVFCKSNVGLLWSVMSKKLKRTTMYYANEKRAELRAAEYSSRHH